MQYTCILIVCLSPLIISERPSKKICDKRLQIYETHLNNTSQDTEKQEDCKDPSNAPLINITIESTVSHLRQKTTGKKSSPFRLKRRHKYKIGLRNRKRRKNSDSLGAATKFKPRQRQRIEAFVSETPTLHFPRVPFSKLKSIPEGRHYNISNLSYINVTQVSPTPKIPKKKIVTTIKTQEDEIDPVKIAYKLKTINNKNNTGSHLADTKLAADVEINKRTKQKIKKQKKRKLPKSKFRNLDSKSHNKGSRNSNNNTNNKKHSSSNNSNTSKLRLLSSVVPVHYNLTLVPNFQVGLQLNGSVEIEVEVRHTTQKFRIHNNGLIIEKDDVKIRKLKGSKVFPIRRLRENSFRQVLGIKVGRRLKAGVNYILSIKFTKEAHHGFKSLIRKDYVDDDRRIKQVFVTHFFPIGAREVFPCFDEPQLKASFDIKVRRHKNLTAISNMPLILTKPYEDNSDYEWDQFATTPRMSTYQVGLIIGDFVSTTLANHTTRIQVWTRPSVHNLTTTFLQTSRSALHFYEAYFDLESSLPQLAFVALPNGVSVQARNWGLVVLSESSVLDNPKDSSWLYNQVVTVSESISAQWLCGLVTLQWWDSLWQNEGLVAHHTALSIEKLRPKWRTQELLSSSLLHEAMQKEELFIPFVSPITTLSRSSSPSFSFTLLNHINEKKNLRKFVNYQKGSSIFQMLSHFLTQETFKKAMQMFLRQNMYSNVDIAVLLECLALSARQDGSVPQGISVPNVMKTWLHQTAYPVVSVTRIEGRKAVLKQNRFQFYGGRLTVGTMNSNTPSYTTNTGNNTTNNNNSNNGRWWIPINFTVQKRPFFGHTQAQTWMRPDSSSLFVTGMPLNTQWVIFNLRQTGFYRVHYSPPSWHLLVAELHHRPTRLHVSTRAQLVDDALSLAKVGLLPYSIAFRVSLYLKAEEDVLPWKAAVAQFEYIEAMLRNRMDYGAFRDFMLALLSPQLDSLGFQKIPGEPVHRSLLREVLVPWACRLGHPKCVGGARDLILAWVNNQTRLPTNYSSLSSFLCAGVRVTEEVTWSFIWRQLRQNQQQIELSQELSADQQQAVQLALTCSRKAWLLHRYLYTLTMHSSTVKSDLAESLEWASQNRLGQFIAWKILRSLWLSGNIGKRVPVMTAVAMFEVVTQSFNTKQQMREVLNLREIIRSQSNSSSIAPLLLATLTQALAYSEANVMWIRDSYGIIVDWLEENGFSAVLIQD